MRVLTLAVALVLAWPAEAGERADLNGDTEVDILDSALLRRHLAGLEPGFGSCGLLATGQTTCSDPNGVVIDCIATGFDGEFQTGVPLGYVDNGDGTVIDLSTSLMWEKKSDDGSIHDVDTKYTWDEAFAVHVAGLNGAVFAGHTDWRIPNNRELVSIVDFGRPRPPVDPVFNTGCEAGCTVTMCSCVMPNRTWSATFNANTPSRAWDVDFNDGAMTGFLRKGGEPTQTAWVRAVRGGL